jgi:hypothetical protein
LDLKEAGCPPEELMNFFQSFFHFRLSIILSFKTKTLFNLAGDCPTSYNSSSDITPAETGS